jgi:hypothetical protein
MHTNNYYEVEDLINTLLALSRGIMEYEVAFEIATNGIGGLTSVIPGLLFMIVGAGLIKFRGELAEKRPRWFVNFFSFFFFGFAVLWTLGAGLAIGLKQSSLREA